MSADIKRNPKVSVCIPTYNAARTISYTLKSVIEQTYTNLEILIVDNDSSDNTLSVVNEFRDPRINVYRNEKNLGGEGNFTRCIGLASGEYTAIFHADDIYTPEMICKQVEAFQKNDNVLAVSTMAKHINEKNEFIGKSDIPARLKKKEIYNFDDIFASVLQHGNFLICPSFMVRTDVYKELAPFNGTDFRTSADLDMWFRILKRGPIMILKDYLMNYRIDENHFTHHYEYLRTEPRNFFRVVDHHLMLVNKHTNKISQKEVDKYQLLKSCDEIVCSINLLIKNKQSKAKRMLKQSSRRNAFYAAARNPLKPKYMFFLISGKCLMILIKYGLWNRWFSRFLNELRYRIASDLFY
ncbi:glycosyltransferase [uncultured Methanolobus sp.]|uniref:glycosyltransferase family 2 protein n=1 Tax=uncultured Methanolobus sp. TaxID=218300 RepID=UPI002AAACEEA|nr:glycosyltransferase [uncultured Methanolobus sp.]